MESVLLVTERSLWGRLAADLLESDALDLTHLEYSFGENRDEAMRQVVDWRGDFLIAFKADLWLPRCALSRVRAAVNFHPAPPWYRGVAGPERAVKSSDRVYGTTCHHMNSELDAGEIIDIRTFSVPLGTSSTALRLRAAAECLSQLAEQWMLRGNWHTSSAGDVKDIKWSGDMFTCGDASAEHLFA